MTPQDLTRLLRAAADTADTELSSRASHTVQEWAAFKVLVWLAAGASDVFLDQKPAGGPEVLAARLAGKHRALLAGQVWDDDHSFDTEGLNFIEQAIYNALIDYIKLS